MNVDKEKIRQKIHFMRENLKNLQQFQGMSIGEFMSNKLNEHAAIRMLQITIEATLDICAHAIAREGWGLPKNYAEVVEIAAGEGIIPFEMRDTYKKMARFRNRVVHLYDDVNPEEVLDIINCRLDDFGPFLENVINKYFSSNQD